MRFHISSAIFVRSDFYLRQPRLALITNGDLVAIGTDRYHNLQRVGAHWSPLIQIATDVGSRWEKRPNSDSKAFSESSKFWSRILVPAFPVWCRQIQIPCGTRGKIGHQIN